MQNILKKEVTDALGCLVTNRIEAEGKRRRRVGTRGVQQKGSFRKNLERKICVTRHSIDVEENDILT